MSGEREGIASMGKRCADRRWPIFQAFGRRQPTVRSTRLRSRKIIERERHALCLRGLPVARLRDRSHPAEPIRLACGSPAAPDPEAVSIERRSSTTPRICMRSNRPTCSPRAQLAHGPTSRPPFSSSRRTPTSRAGSARLVGIASEHRARRCPSALDAFSTPRWTPHAFAAVRHAASGPRGARAVWKEARSAALNRQASKSAVGLRMPYARSGMSYPVGHQLRFARQALKLWCPTALPIYEDEQTQLSRALSPLPPCV